MIGWEEKYPCRTLPNGHIRGVGLAMAMQGSAISGIDVGGATLKVNDEGFINLLIGAGDMGTGCDTTLAQVAAECLEVPVDQVVTAQVDTDTSPMTRAYAVFHRLFDRRRRLQVRPDPDRQDQGGGRPAEGLEDRGCGLSRRPGGAHPHRGDGDPGGGGLCLRVRRHPHHCHRKPHLLPQLPAPFMAGAAEIDLDPETGKVTLVEYDAVVDCGTPLNSNLARVQTEGGLVQASAWPSPRRCATTPTAVSSSATSCSIRFPPGRTSAPSM